MKVIISIFILINLNSFAQSLPIWTNNTIVNMTEYFGDNPIIKNDNQSVTVIGRKNTSNGQRLLIEKFDLSGNVVSSIVFGNDAVVNNVLIDYKFDSAENLYLLHKEQIGSYKSKIIIQKYSLAGNLIWINQIQSLEEISYTPQSIAITNDNNIFISGYKETNYPVPGDDSYSTISFTQLYYYDSNGNQVWQREFNPTNELDYISYGIFINNNNTAYLGGYVGFSYNYNLIKVDTNNIMSINTNSNIQNGISDIQSTPDNNLLITAGAKYRVSKADMNGTVLWTNYYGTYLPSNVGGDTIQSTIQDEFGNIYITGRHYGQFYGTPSYTNCDILTIKYDTNGNLIWQNRYMYLGNNCDQGYALFHKNGKIYVGGESERQGVPSDYDYLVLKMDATTGLTNGVYRYNGLENGSDSISSLTVFDNGNVALTGLSFLSPSYAWTTQLLSDITLSNESFKDNNSQTTIYPNPIKGDDILNIDGNLYDDYYIISSIGQTVQSGNFEKNNLQSIQLNNLKKGLYLLELKTKKNVTTKRFIVK